MFLIPPSWYSVRRTKQKGRGVFALHDIASGTIIGDYLGILMDPKEEDEERDGLYTMIGGLHYNILGNPKTTGIHLINHSCANNCDIYPYQGHILYFASRKIFKGEEITADYWLYAPWEHWTNCAMHVCYCSSTVCTGSMHHALSQFEPMEKLWEKNFGTWYRKIPGKYGEQLSPLKKYPQSIKKDYPTIYNLFGSENKPPTKYPETILPPIVVLRNKIRETGRRLLFPKLKMALYGVRNGVLLVKRH
jgi:hypothetical protein